MRRVLMMLAATCMANGISAEEAKTTYPPLPEGFSSFGAVASQNFAYVYGGHVAPTHQYSTEAVTGKFRRLDLNNVKKGWQELPPGTPLQGLGLAEHQGKIYRIGGMEPRNKPGEKADNHSVASCSVFDPKTNAWSALPDLPEPRSSHDAVVIGDRLFVAGGWTMKGRGSKIEWRDTLLSLDLNAKSPKWEAVPQPFRRRALNVANVEGKLFVVCGMNADDEIERVVDIYDPAMRKWSQAPELPGVKRNGFAPAALGVRGRLFVSPSDGKVYELTKKQTAWEEIATLEQPRIVHRLVDVGGERLLVLGGAAKNGENVAKSEIVRIPSPAKGSTNP